MIYRKIDISEAVHYNVSDDVAKALIDWRIDSVKKPITQRIFDNALKSSVKCVNAGWSMIQSEEDALDKWMESGWTGMNWVLKMATEQALAEKAKGVRSTRDQSLQEELLDRGWAGGGNLNIEHKVN